MDKTIEEFPMYIISETGDVYSLYLKRNLKLQKTKTHYKISLRDKDERVRNMGVHRLVALVHIPNPENLLYVVHINLDGFDNRVENLEWTSNNSKYMREQGKTSRRPIYQCDKKGKVIKEFESLVAAARELELNKNTIQACCCGRLKECGGYMFKYATKRVIDRLIIDGEVWEKISDHTKYQVSNFGRVRTSRGLLRQGTSREYPYFTAYGDVKTKTLTTHIQVAKAFIPNPRGCPVVNHKDGNKTNNHVENLEWVTLSENIQHAVDTGLTPCKRAVTQYSPCGEKIAEWESMKEASKHTSAHIVSISNCCRRKCNSSGGYIWRYASDPLGEMSVPGLPKKVDQYSLDGKFIQTYISISSASEDTSVATGNIIKACKKFYNQSGGFIWRYHGDSVDTQDLANLISRKQSRVRQLTINGEHIREWNTIKEAASELGIFSSSISAICAKRKHYKSAGGWKWEYVE